MSYVMRWLVAVLIISSLPLLACQQEQAVHHTEHPAEIESVEGTELSRLILTGKAIQRLGIETVEVDESPQRGITTASLEVDPEAPRPGSGTKRTVVPYAAVLYDVHGNTWVYITPKPRTFVRHKIDVDYIEGDVAVLEDGPPLGTKVVTVGAAMLFGTERGIGSSGY